jgi:hypothetical protein
MRSAPGCSLCTKRDSPAVPGDLALSRLKRRLGRAAAVRRFARQSHAARAPQPRLGAGPTALRSLRRSCQPCTERCTLREPSRPPVTISGAPNPMLSPPQPGGSVSARPAMAQHTVDGVHARLVRLGREGGCIEALEIPADVPRRANTVRRGERERERAPAAGRTRW